MWPEPFVYTIEYCIYGHFPAEITVHTYIHIIIWFWPPLQTRASHADRTLPPTKTLLPTTGGRPPVAHAHAAPPQQQQQQQQQQQGVTHVQLPADLRAKLLACARLMTRGTGQLKRSTHGFQVGRGVEKTRAAFCDYTCAPFRVYVCVCVCVCVCAIDSVRYRMAEALYAQLPAGDVKP